MTIYDVQGTASSGLSLLLSGKSKSLAVEGGRAGGRAVAPQPLPLRIEPNRCVDAGRSQQTRRMYMRDFRDKRALLLLLKYHFSVPVTASSSSASSVFVFLLAWWCFFCPTIFLFFLQYGFLRFLVARTYVRRSEVERHRTARSTTAIWDAISRPPSER